MNEKCCTSCGESKPLEAYAINRKGKYGRQASCKACLNARAVKWREENRQRLREAALTAYRRSTEHVSAVEARRSRESLEAAGLRACRKCGRVLSINEFPWYSVPPNRARRHTCRACRAQDWREYVSSNTEQVRMTKNASWHRRRARLSQSLVDPHVTVAWLRARDGDDCSYCGRTLDFNDRRGLDSSAHLEHIVPIARGGEHSEANCVLSCRKCNLLKGTGEWSLSIPAKGANPAEPPTARSTQQA